MKKIIIITVIVVLIAAYEYWNYSTHADYRASLRTVTCYGRTLNIKRTACCHNQCEGITEWPTQEDPPANCQQHWDGEVE